MTNESAAVTVRNLVKSYGALKALGGISFNAVKGRVFAYLGPNGAGKTTTINVLCGLIERDGGEVSILGRDVARPGASQGAPGPVGKGPRRAARPARDRLLRPRGAQRPAHRPSG